MAPITCFEDWNVVSQGQQEMEDEGRLQPESSGEGRADLSKDTAFFEGDAASAATSDMAQPI